MRPYRYEQPEYFYQEDMDVRKSNLNYASTGQRIIAFIIDSIIIGLVMGAIYAAALFFGYFSLGSGIGGGGFSPFGFYGSIFPALSFLNYLLKLLYFTYFESKDGGGGATFGKRIIGIKVVDKDGRKVSGSDSFKRNIARLLWALPCIGFIILLLDVYLIHDSEQRIGDRIADTYVVEDVGYDQPSSGYQGSYQRPQYDQYPQRTQSYEQQKDYDDRRPTYNDEMQKCPQCGKKSLMVNSDGSAYCTRCDYISMKKNYNRYSQDFSR